MMYYNDQNVVDSCYGIVSEPTANLTQLID